LRNEDNEKYMGDSRDRFCVNKAREVYFILPLLVPIKNVLRLFCPTATATTAIITTRSLKSEHIYRLSIFFPKK